MLLSYSQWKEINVPQKLVEGKLSSASILVNLQAESDNEDNYRKYMSENLDKIDTI